MIEQLDRHSSERPGASDADIQRSATALCDLVDRRLVFDFDVDNERGRRRSSDNIAF
jgi:hypothetical protein